MIVATSPFCLQSSLICSTAIVCLSTLGCTTLTSKNHDSDKLTTQQKTVALFSTAAADGTIPQGWEPYILRRDRRPTQYGSAALDGRTVLRASANAASASAICRVDISPSESPWLTWQWRVDRLIDKADVSVDGLDDSPARVFIAFDGDPLKMPAADIAFFDMVKFLTGKDLPYATLSYVWDPALPIGTVVAYSHSSRIKYIVVESGSDRLGRWTSYQRNIVDDYRRAFGEAPGTVISVGVMNDSDDLAQHAESFFGDIVMQSAAQVDTSKELAITVNTQLIPGHN